MYGADAADAGNVRRDPRGDFFEYDYTHGFDAEFSPEEIFNMFFGGGFPTESVRRTRHGFHASTHSTRNQNANPYTPLLQLLPLIAILVLGLLAQLMVGEPAYSLHHTNKYPIKRLTQSSLKVPYFVKSDFEQAYRGRIRQDISTTLESATSRISNDHKESRKRALSVEKDARLGRKDSSNDFEKGFVQKRPRRA